MGGTGDLLLPVGVRRLSSWTAHQHRVPRSNEPGTDFYCPIGTPVLAPADGVIYGYGNSIVPATGRWVGIHFQSGMAFRAMHLSRIVKFSGLVRRGDILGYSGASGYGVEDWSSNPNTGGAHVHVTLWPTIVKRFGYDSQGKPFTIDFMNFVGGSSAGGGTGEWDEMATKQEIKEALDEVLIERKSGPGGRNFWDSQNFIADLAAAGVADNVWAKNVQALNDKGQPLYYKSATDKTQTIAPTAFPVTYTAAGFLASTNALANSIYAGRVNAAQVKLVAAEVAKLGSTANIDYSALADKVNAQAG